MRNVPYNPDESHFYYAPPDVINKVNLALLLGKPILVEGEPGCGKTTLATSIAELLTQSDPIKIMVKSTHRAQDLLYRFDALLRLQDVQLGNADRAQHIYPYLTLGPLGRSILGDQRQVVLIDEIDKADIDFPNDLLDVLDTYSFQIDPLPETEIGDFLTQYGIDAAQHYYGGMFEAGAVENRPVIVITSNREKRLPEPFLRRCMYIYLNFPKEPEALHRILKKNIENIIQMNDDVVLRAIQFFKETRTLAEQSGAQKLPGPSELIDWVRVLLSQDLTPDNFEEFMSFGAWEMLLKTAADIERYRAMLHAKSD